MKVIYRAGKQGYKVRALSLVSLLALAGSIWAGWILFNTFGLREADGGVLASLGVRTAWAIGVSSLGLAFSGGMWLYCSLYVATVEQDGEGSRVIFKTMGFLRGGRTEISSGPPKGSRYNQGHLRLRFTIKAPWISVRIKNRRFPLILDLQGEMVDREAMRKLFGKGVLRD